MNNKFSVVYTNDIHSNVPDALHIFHHISLKKQNSLVVDSGDFTEGHPFYNLFKGKPEKELITSLYDVISPGNHGFINMVELSKNGFPVINANIFEKNHLLFRPSFISSIGVIKIGFIGIMSIDSFYTIDLKERKTLRIEDPIINLRKEIFHLREKVDYLFVLSHSGIEYDTIIAESFPEIDVIISGHCHSIDNEVLINKVLVIKAPELGAGFGEIIIDRDERLNKIVTPNLNSSSNNLSFLDPYIEEYQRHYSIKLFTISPDFSSKFNNRQLLTSYLVENIRSDFCADLCLINYHCLRNIFPPQVITLEILYKCLPFNTVLVGFDVKKKKFRKYLQTLPASVSEFLIMSEGYSEKTGLIHVVTTDYLMDNYFASVSPQNISPIIPLNDYVIKHFGGIDYDFDRGKN